MVLSREITARIKEVLEKHPEGLSITALVESVDVNRNTAGRYLENLLLSGQVEMRRFGMAKLYTLTKRLPVSSVLSISSELVLQLDFSQRIFYANDTLLTFLEVPAKDLFGKNIEFTPFSIVFEDVFPELLDRFRQGLKGEEWRGELSRPVKGTFFFCRIAPTVFNEGTKGVSVLLEDITDQKRDEERIRESEARLRSIFMASPVGIGVVVNRVFQEVNDRLCQMTGYSASELVGRSARMLYPSDREFDRVGTEKYNQMRQSGTGSVETRWVKKDGTVIDIILSSTPLDPANISGGITFTALDITERKQAEEALRESEAKLQLALSGSEIGMWEMNIPSSEGSIDERAAGILGYRKNSIGSFRADWDALSHPDDVPLIHRRLADYLEGRTPVFESEHRMRHTSGKWVWVVGRGKITHSMPDGSCIRITGTMQDITARKQAEQELRESEDRYRKLVEISPDAVILHRDGKIIYVNPAAVRLTGAGGSDELIGRDILDVVAPEHRDSVYTSISRDLAGETTPPMELQILRVDKKPVMVEGRGVSTFIEGRPAVLVALNDITDRYQAGLALKKSEERYRSMFENTGAATTIVDENTIISLANNEFERLSGYTKREIEMKKSWTEFVVKEDLETMLARHYQRRERADIPRQYEFRFIRRNGDIRQVLITIDLIPGTTQTVASLIDITDRKLADEQLLQREQQYRFIADNSLDIITRLSIDFLCLYVSPAITPLLGYSEIELLGKYLLSLIHPEDLEQSWNTLDTVVRSGSAQLTLTFRLRHKDGHYSWFESTVRIIRDEKTGRVREYLCISRDITARKSAGKDAGGG
ncbi:MAG: PAS domain S-box protein [Methanoregula sp.]|nr:PAS domain S-box protein [Methanoregula sp.]